MTENTFDNQFNKSLEEEEEEINERMIQRKSLAINQNQTNSFTPSLMRFLFTIIKLLKTSSGRNKICGLVQYICKFSANCIIYTIDTNDIKNSIDDIEMIYNRHLNLKRIEKSMSNGRKIFRFLKFVEDIKKFINLVYESSFDSKTVLKAFIALSGGFYHFLDNLVWASNVGMINRVFTGDINWKTSKNFFSIIRTLIKLFTAFIEFKNCYYSSWIKNDNEIVNENYDKIINETIKNRSRLRMLTVDILQYLLKLTTLIYSSKIQPLYSLLHPIIVSFCGILFCCISIFKIYMKMNEVQKKMLSDYKKSHDSLARYSNANLFSFNNNQNNNLLVNVRKLSSGSKLPIITGNNQTLNTNIGSGPTNHFTFINKIKSFEFSLIERVPNQKLLNDEHYFDNYYIDFNKDFPIHPELVLKANEHNFQNIIS